MRTLLLLFILFLSFPAYSQKEPAPIRAQNGIRTIRANIESIGGGKETDGEDKSPCAGTCSNCDNLVRNSGFEELDPSAYNQQGQIAIEGMGSISGNYVASWICDHGTVDLYGPGYHDWYEPPLIQTDNMAHLCYGDNHNNHSEGFSQFLEFYPDSDITYCVSMEAAKISDAKNEDFNDGELVFNVQNQSECNIPNWSPPTYGTAINSFRISNDIRKEGMQCYSTTFTVDQNYRVFQLYSIGDQDLQKGILIDNVTISCQSTALENIQVDCRPDNILITPFFENGFDISLITEYQWSSPQLGNLGNSSQLVLDPDINNGEPFTVILNVKDSRGCCGTLSTVVDCEDDPECSNRISGFAFCDHPDSELNVLDDLDGPIPLIVVTLWDLTTNPYEAVASTTTSTDGYYRFENVCDGTYLVGFSPNSDVTPVESNFTGNQAIDSQVGGMNSGFNNQFVTSALYIGNATNQDNWHAGFNCEEQDFCTAYIGNQLWCDIPGGAPNAYDAGDDPLTGVSVDLVDLSNNQTVGSTVSDGNGNYLFSQVCPGTYMVVLYTSETAVVPDAAPENVDSDVTGSNGSGQTIGPITVVAGDVALTWDGGFNCGNTAFRTYPNPAVEFTNAMVDVQQAGDYTLLMQDSYGLDKQVIYKGHLDAGEHKFEIDLSQAKSKIYNVILVGQQKIKTHKLIIGR